MTSDYLKISGRGKISFHLGRVLAHNFEAVLAVIVKLPGNPCLQSFARMPKTYSTAPIGSTSR